MANEYPKAFEDWYCRHTFVQCLHGFQFGEYKRALYNAWKSGRRHEKRRQPQPENKWSQYEQN